MGTCSLLFLLTQSQFLSAGGAAVGRPDLRRPELPILEGTNFQLTFEEVLSKDQKKGKAVVMA